MWSSVNWHLVHLQFTFCKTQNNLPNVGILAKGEGVLSFWSDCEERYNYLRFSEQGNGCNVKSTEKPPWVRCDYTGPPPGENKPEASSVNSLL